VQCDDFWRPTLTRSRAPAHGRARAVGGGGGEAARRARAPLHLVPSRWPGTENATTSTRLGVTPPNRTRHHPDHQAKSPPLSLHLPRRRANPTREAPRAHSPHLRAADASPPPRPAPRSRCSPPLVVAETARRWPASPTPPRPRMHAGERLAQTVLQRDGRRRRPPRPRRRRRGRCRRENRCRRRRPPQERRHSPRQRTDLPTGSGRR